MRTSREEQELVFALSQLRGASGGPETAEPVLQMLAAMRQRSPAAAERVDRALVEEVRRLQAAVASAHENQERLKELLDTLTRPPAFPATFLGARQEGDRQAMVRVGGQRRVVGCDPELDLDALCPGDEVLLGSEMNAVLGRSPFPAPRHGELATFDRMLGDGRAIIRHRDDEMVVDVAGAGLKLQAGDQVRWDRDSWMIREPVARSGGDRYFFHDVSKASWADIGGLDEQIAQMQRSIRLRAFHPEVVRKYGLAPLGSILLVGPPGTGKTMLAAALARWLGEVSRSGRSRFIAVKPGELHSMWYAQTEANYRDVFRVGREAGEREPDVPVVIFFDEVDAVSGSRGKSFHRVDDRVVQALGAELDGICGRGNILVVAATNRRDAMDPALLRPGRFGDCVIEVPRPNARAARDIFARYLGAAAPYAVNGHGADAAATRLELIDSAVSHIYAPNGDAALVELTFRDGKRRRVKARELMSGASIAKICRVATERACFRELEAEESGIRLEDLLEGIWQEMRSLSTMLTPVNCREHLGDLPQDVDVVRLESLVSRQPAVHRYAAAV